MSPTQRNRWLTALGLLVVLILTAFVYRPGLSGGFLFDDYANLPALGATGPVDNLATLARYLTSGNADPTGRPIAMATFLLDARNWPASPAPFLRTNLALHLLNIALLAGLLLALGRAAGLGDAHARRGALLGAALWGLHPLLVSTTLYIVQREAMLPATFIFGGLWMWIVGRRRWQAGHAVSGAVLAWLGIGGGTLLATLSKADGALMGFFVLLIEWLVLRPQDAQRPPQAYRLTLAVVAALPAAAVLGYLVSLGVHLVGAPAPLGRDWTVGQRLLTEPRVLFDYLKLLWLPRPFTPGLFNDQIQASVGLWRPATTLPSLLGVAALVVGAVALRRRAPPWALAVLFYFCGQLLESSVVPLELYFEHRNYVPAALMFWPLALWLTGATESPGTRAPQRVGRRPAARGVWKAVLAVVIVGLLAGMTYSRASLWGNQTEQALLWARLNPESPRAQSYAAQILTARGQPEWALKHLRPLLARDPGQIQIAFNLVGADCAVGLVPEADIAATVVAIRSTGRLGALAFNWVGGAITKARNGSCPGLTFPVVERFLDAAADNPRTLSAPGWQEDILNLRGRLALARDEHVEAYRYFAEALRVRGEPQVALRQAATLGDAGLQRLALCELGLLDTVSAPAAQGVSMTRLHAWVLARQHYWPHEVTHLRDALARDLPENQRDDRCPTVPGPPSRVAVGTVSGTP